MKYNIVRSQHNQTYHMGSGHITLLNMVVGNNFDILEQNYVLVLSYSSHLSILLL